MFLLAVVVSSHLIEIDFSEMFLFSEEFLKIQRLLWVRNFLNPGMKWHDGMKMPNHATKMPNHATKMPLPKFQKYWHDPGMKWHDGGMMA